MYDNPTSAAAVSTASAGILAIGGVNVLWLIIAAVALIGVGAAILRFFPRKEK